ncbi:uncharacterized protein LOC128221796 [Mya arenaria]|uniref:uncharacterized protein LOC128221796 n=1 Tax=Mya arenaria TaxID=6604 RepID=UPI0022DFD907|nr:uncharacterized protein LOC128221796 [Mya arenaria]
MTTRPTTMTTRSTTPTTTTPTTITPSPIASTTISVLSTSAARTIIPTTANTPLMLSIESSSSGLSSGIYNNDSTTVILPPFTTPSTSLNNNTIKLNQTNIDTTVSSVHNTDSSILMSILTKTQSFTTSFVPSSKTTSNTYITDSAYNNITHAPIHVNTENNNYTDDPLVRNTSVFTQTNKYIVSTETIVATASQNTPLNPESSHSMQTSKWESVTPSVTNYSPTVTTQIEHLVSQSIFPTHRSPQTPITTSFISNLISTPTDYNYNITVSEYKSTQVLSTLREVTTPNVLNVSESQSLTETSRMPTTSAKPTVIITSPISTTTERIDLCPYKFLSEVHENIQNKVFRQYGKYCYELRLKTGTWLDASKDCSERGGMLVVITDPHVQSLVHGLVNNLQPPADIWLGLSDRAEEGVWRWVDGQPISYTNWTPVDPVFNDINDCAIMSHNSGNWMQAECSFYMLHTERLPWVCQYAI